MANQLIAGLAAAEREQLLQRAELLELNLHAVLQTADEPEPQLWFPVEGLVAQLLPLPAGRTSHARPRAARASSDPETGATLSFPPSLGMNLVGNEGLIGTSALLGAPRASLTSRVLMAGRAFRLGRSELQDLLQESAIRERFFAYVALRQRQLAQQAACMNFHTVEQRLVRCLLTVRDRVHASELFLTHELLAPLLGVRRESVTQAASALQRRGLISYSRGYLMLLDEPALERISCGCYQADLASYAQAFAYH